jgi:hypothetical protein
MKFHFKSINTWLMGVCKSFCADHSWRSSLYDPGKKSIFAENEDEQCQAAEEEEGSSEEQQQPRFLLDTQSHEEQDKTSHSLSACEGERIPKVAVENEMTHHLSDSHKRTEQDKLPVENVQVDQESLNDKDTNMAFQELVSEERDFRLTSKSEKDSNNDLDSYVFDNEQLEKEGVYCDKMNCLCPECFPTYRSCIHGDDKNHEDKISNLEIMSSNELTSSLECFEVIASPECRREVDHAIASCPFEKAETNGNNGSTSPPNDDNPSKGKTFDCKIVKFVHFYSVMGRGAVM